MSALSKVRGVNICKDDTRRMEDEARKMELKMDMLRKTMEGADAKNSGRSGGDGGSRWKSGSAKKPIRSGYVKDVLESKPTRSAVGNKTQLRPRDAAPENSGSHSGSCAASGQTTPTAVEAAAEAQDTFAGVLGATGATADKTTRAAANLQAAMQQHSKEGLEVEAFLASLGLDRYVSLFMEHGFDCIEVVQEMEESHMRDIGMAAGHALKLRKRLAELKPAPAPQPAPRAAPPAVATGASAGATQKRVSFGDTEQAPPPCSGTATGDGGGSLLDGHYDEEEQTRGFQEAIRAWREGGKPAKAEAPVAAPKLSAGSFWNCVGGDEVNLDRCSTPVSTPAGTMTLASETQHDPAPSEEKLVCYRCYKQFYAKYCVERASPLPDGSIRRLCSESCANLWIATMNAKAEEFLQRQEKLAKLQEMKRVMDYEASIIETGTEVAVAA
jgi:hypothetical protein